MAPRQRQRQRPRPRHGLSRHQLFLLFRHPFLFNVTVVVVVVRLLLNFFDFEKEDGKLTKMTLINSFLARIFPQNYSHFHPNYIPSLSLSFPLSFSLSLSLTLTLSLTLSHTFALITYYISEFIVFLFKNL